ncbi:tripartite tricarboxylate transporter substrate binding protein [Caldimonas tepidiphila]|uniref:tripartite tricarboxylate transporter substrate binding protein n=1 Tax=Caldimonas tepidiphila TaxID=2315841 RepID=UPI001F0C1DCB|nr:tripartite tricarboxylate transporter substrate binding protein [Caldimonas tepidiphila]
MPQYTRRQFSLGLLAAGLGASLPQGAAARPDWPSKAVRLIVPQPPGGFSDLIARLLAQEFREQLGQPLVVENKPGANGIVGVGQLAKSRPDDHSFGLVFPAFAAQAGSQQRLPYDPQLDLEPVSLVGLSPLVAAVHRNAPFATVAEMVEHARRNPGRINFGSAGSGSASHLGAELLQALTGISMVHIPYRGAVPALVDVAGGQIHLCFEAAAGLLATGLRHQVRLIGVASERRLPALPEVPTFGEQGLPGFTASSWAGMLAPADTSVSVVHRMSATVAHVLRRDTVRARLQALGTLSIGSTPHEFERFMADEAAKWGEVLRHARPDAPNP